MTSNEYVRQYAVMMPNGEIFSHPVPVKKTEQQDEPSYTTLQMLGISGLFGSVSPPAPPAATRLEPVIFDTREDAEQQAAYLAERAAQFGVTYWGGMVVERLCTPFTSADPAVQFRDAVIAWSQQQQGSAS